jgi:hypothetical protein
MYVVQNFVGVWTGTFEASSCQDIDPPGLIALHLCSDFAPFHLPARYQFTLTQSGTAVAGAYKLVTPFFSCPCNGDYGTFNMSGTISSDGTLDLSASGIPTATGLTAAMTFNLRMSDVSTMTGSLSGILSFFGYDRASFKGTITSGTR